MDCHFVRKGWIAFAIAAFRGNGVDGFRCGIGPLRIQNDYLIGICSAEFAVARIVFVCSATAISLGVPTSEYFAVIFEFVWFQRRCVVARAGCYF